jgi:hypothetical protein
MTEGKTERVKRIKLPQQDAPIEDDAKFKERLKEKKPYLLDENRRRSAKWSRTHNHRVSAKKRVFGNITYGEVEEAIWNSEGMLTSVARDLKLSVYYVKSILSKYKLLRQDFEEHREALLDETEECLMEKIRRGDTTAMIFFLKCVGKQRGYVEYERAAKSKGSVRMKIVPATEANVKKQKKDAETGANVLPFIKVEKAESNG